MKWLRITLSGLCVFLLTLWSMYAALGGSGMFRLPMLSLLLGGIVTAWATLRMVPANADKPGPALAALGEWFRPWQLAWAGSQLAVFAGTVAVLAFTNADFASLIDLNHPGAAAIWQTSLQFALGGIVVFLVGCAILNRLLGKRAGAATLYGILMGLLAALCLVHLYIPGLVAATFGPFARRIMQQLLEQ